MILVYNETSDHIIFIRTRTLRRACIFLAMSEYSWSVRNLNFVTILRQNCITNKYNAAKALRRIYEQNSVIDCERLTYALDNIVYNALYEK